MATLLVTAGINLAIGIAANLLFRPKQPDITQEGPRLPDLSLSTSAYGTPLPIHEGTVRTGGNYIYAPDIDEVANTETQEAGGKGGGGGGSVTTTTYTYFATWGIAFGEGTAKDVLKLWANGKLVFDKTNPSLSGSKYKFTFYPGNETQLPDPIIEAREGIGNVEPYRGTCYLVADNWPLADFGNGRPNLTALIAYEAIDTAPFNSITELSPYTPPTASGNFIQIDPATDDFYTFGTLGINGIVRGSLSSEAFQAGTFGSFFGYSSVFGADGFVYSQRNSSSNWTSLYKIDPVSFEILAVYGGDGATCTFTTNGCMPNGCRIGVLQVGDPASGTTRDFVVFISDGAISDGQIKVLQQVGSFFTQIFVDTTTSLGSGGNIIQDRINRRCFITQNDVTQVKLYELNIPAGFDETGLSIGVITLDLIGTYLKNGTQLSGTAEATGDCILSNENAVIISNGTSMIKVDLDDGSILANNTSLGFFSRQQTATDGIFAFSRNGSSTDIVTIDTEDLTEIASQSVTLTGLGAQPSNSRPAYDPRSHSIIYARVGAGTDRVVQVFLDRRDAQGVALTSVVTDVFSRLGVPASELDLTDLVGKTVNGYSITRPMSGRAALEPLQAAFFFDIIESDFKLKAIERGGTSLITIPSDDVGISGSNLQIDERRVQEAELPRSAIVRYLDIDLDYQQNAQTDRRVANPTNTQNAISELALDLAIVLDATTAKQLVQKILYTDWAERVSIDSQLDWTYIALDPGDIFETDVGNITRRLRMDQIELGANLQIDFKSVQEDSRTNSSSVVGDSGDGFIRQVPPSLLPTRFLPLDIPLLGAADASFQSFVNGYYALSGFEDGWRGGILFQTRDSGATFVEIGSSSLEAAYGVTRVAIGNPGSVTTWDESVTITLSVQRGIDRFVSSTDAEVLNGANAIAIIGANGPEIIQFVTVTQTTANEVELTRLLRGRLGTEPNSSGHVLGERFVLLESSKILKFQLDLTLRDQLLEYRPATLGTGVEDASPSFFAYTGEDLLPYSVSQLAATRPGGTDFQATWLRRTRFNGEQVDGSDTVPLNEDLEEYDVETSLNGTVIDTKTVTTPVYDLTNAEFLAAGFRDAQFPFANADFETLAGWALANPAVYSTAVGSIVPQNGTRMLYFGNGIIAQEERMLSQTITLASLGFPVDDWDAQQTRPQFTLRYYENAETGVNIDTVRVDVEFLNAASGIITTLADPAHTPTANSWVERSGGTQGIPVGARFVRIRFYGNRGGGIGACNIMVDNIRCSVDSGIPPITTRVWQKSAIVGKGRLEERIL